MSRLAVVPTRIGGGRFTRTIGPQASDCAVHVSVTPSTSTTTVATRRHQDAFGDLVEQFTRYVYCNLPALASDERRLAIAGSRSPVNGFAHFSKAAVCPRVSSLRQAVG